MTSHRVRTVLGTLALAAGGVGLLWPVLTAPIQSDSRYHYVRAASYVHRSLADLVAWTIDDMGWRAEKGRIAPIGVFAQHAVYAAGGEFGVATGTDIYWFHAGVKLALLLASVITFWLLLRTVRLPGGRPLPRAARHTALVVFAFVWAIGPHTHEAFRSGWLTFPVLTIGAVIVVFAMAALALWALNRWSRSGALGRAGMLLVVGAAGAMLSVTYELHYAAVPFALILLLAQGTSHSTFRDSLPAKALVGGVLLTCFIVPVVAIRLYLRDLGCPRGCYPGLEPDIGPHVLGVTGLQLLNAVPGYGATRMWERAERNGLEPDLLLHPGWVFGLLLLVGVGLLLRRRRDPAAAPGGAASDENPTPREVAPLAAAAVVTAIVGAFVMSVSVQAHETMTSPGTPWRCTPLVWSMAATAAAGVAAWLGPRLTTVRGGQWWLAPLFVMPALFVGGVLWPLSTALVTAERSRPGAQMVEAMQHEVVRGDLTAAGDARRCAFISRVSELDGVSWENLRDGAERSFPYFWDQPFCSAIPPLAPRTSDAAPVEGVQVDA